MASYELPTTAEQRKTIMGNGESGCGNHMEARVSRRRRAVAARFVSYTAAAAATYDMPNLTPALSPT